MAGLDEPADAHMPRGSIYDLWETLWQLLQVGLTNVATFMVGPERWDTPMYESLFENPKPSSDVYNQGKFINDLLKVDHFHMQQFAYLIDKMDAIQESDGTTLLDTTYLWIWPRGWCHSPVHCPS